MSDLSWKVKGHSWPLDLIDSHCLIKLNISSEKNDLGFHSLKKQQQKSLLDALRSNWPWRLVGQGPSRIIIWTNLVGLTSPMLHAKSHGHLHSGSGKEDFKGVIPYMAWRPSWLYDQDHLTKLSFPVYIWNLSLIGPVVSDDNKFENVDGQSDWYTITHLSGSGELKIWYNMDIRWQSSGLVLNPITVSFFKLHDGG